MKDARGKTPQFTTAVIAKILLTSLLVAAISSVIFLAVESSHRAQASLRLEADQQRGTMIIASQIEMTFSQFASDLSIIYNSNETADYRQNPNPDTFDELVALFVRIAAQKQHMRLIRFFDRNGLKVAQVQRVADGSVFLVDADDLTPLGDDRDLFLNSHNIGLKSLYISEIHDSPIIGLQTITLALPLFNGNKLSGVLAIDFDSCALLSFLSAYQQTLDKDLFFRLIRPDGSVLTNSLHLCGQTEVEPANIYDESSMLQAAMAKRDLGILVDGTQTFVWQTIYLRTDGQLTFMGSNVPLWRVVSSYSQQDLPHLAQHTLLRYPQIKVVATLAVLALAALLSGIFYLRRTDRAQVEVSSLVAEFADNGIVVYDRDGRVSYANQAFLRLSGYQRHELLGRSSEQFVRRDLSLPADEAPCWVISRDGNILLYTLSSIKVSTSSGIGQRVEVYTVCSWPSKEEALTQIVQPLIDYLAIDALIEREGEISALFIRLENSRQIGLELSPSDQSSLALSICSALATLFNTEIRVSSFGYTGYLVMLPKVGMTESLAKRIRHALTVLESPPDERSKGLTLRFVCGVANFPSTSFSANALLSDAYLASEMALAEKGSRYLFYTGEVRSHIERQNEIHNSLATLFSSQQLFLAYQPIVSLATGAIVGAEALVRWTHPTLGPIRPDEFLPALIKEGLSERLGRFVIANALSFLSTYQGVLKKITPHFSLSINLSAEEFSNPSLIDYLGSMLREHRVKDHEFCVELTEHTAIESLQSASVIIDKLRAQGVSIAIDDFGTGYSSLSYLLELGADKVKIDRSFIARYPSSESVTIFKTVLLLAQQIKAQVVAEGVETEEQLNFIKEIGCDEYQGFYCSPALPQEQFIALLERTKA